MFEYLYAVLHIVSLFAYFTFIDVTFGELKIKFKVIL